MSSTSLKTHIHVLQSALSVMKLIKKKKNLLRLKPVEATWNLPSDHI